MESVSFETLAQNLLKFSGRAVDQRTVRLGSGDEPSVYSVKVEGRNGEEPYRIKGADIKDGVLELAPYSANYRVFGLFRNNRDTMYKMEFYFKIILPEE